MLLLNLGWGRWTWPKFPPDASTLALWFLTCWFLEPELTLVRWYGGVLLHKNIYWSVLNKALVTELETSQQTPGTQYLGEKSVFPD